MDSNRTQVNVNRNDRNRIPPWAWGALAAAALLLILGLMFFLNRPPEQPAVTPTVTPTVAVVEVTSTPNLLTPSATPVTVEVTPTPGSPTPEEPTATARIVQVTATPAPATQTPQVATTITAPATVTQAGTGASPSPQVTMTAGEQEIMNLLTASPNVGSVSSVKFDGTNVEVEYQIAAGGAGAAREQVRAMLVALTGSNLNYSKVMLSGSETPGQGTPAIELTYDRNTVTTTDWANAPDADIYGKAETQTIQPPYNTP